MAHRPIAIDGAGATYYKYLFSGVLSRMFGVVLIFSLLALFLILFSMCSTVF